MLVVSRNTTLVPSMGLRLGPSPEAGLSAGIRKSVCHHKGERNKEEFLNNIQEFCQITIEACRTSMVCVLKERTCS